MRNERYYYSIMKDYEKAAYKTVYEGIVNRSHEIHVTSMYSAADLQILYLKLLFDNPLFYYVNQKVIKLAGGPRDFYLMPEYLYTQREIAQMNGKIKTIVDHICGKARLYEGEFRKEKFLHDSIIKTVAYDYDALSQNDCFDAHSIIGVFFRKRAVCEGIAKAFKLLCNELDIKCMIVVGRAGRDQNSDIEEYHAWNIVKIEGDSYYVDVTWDNTFDADFRHISYDYFNVTTEEILIDHTPEEELPSCSAQRLNYFHYTNSFVSNFHELKELMRGRLQKDSIIFKVKRPSAEFQDIKRLQNGVFCALEELASEEGGKLRPCRILFNDALMIGKIFFMYQQAV